MADPLKAGGPVNLSSFVKILGDALQNPGGEQENIRTPQPALQQDEYNSGPPGRIFNIEHIRGRSVAQQIIECKRQRAGGREHDRKEHDGDESGYCPGQEIDSAEKTLAQNSFLIDKQCQHKANEDCQAGGQYCPDDGPAGNQPERPARYALSHNNLLEI